MDPEQFPHITWIENGKEFTESITYRLKAYLSGYSADIRNPHAKNKLKLFVVCDSFSTALAPFLNATFSDICYMYHTGT